MGLLVDGAWKDTWYETASSGGRFIRSESQFRDVITGDGGQYPAEPDRYHLYVARACPWEHRALIMRALKGLENFVRSEERSVGQECVSTCRFRGLAYN